MTAAIANTPCRQTLRRLLPNTSFCVLFYKLRILRVGGRYEPTGEYEANVARNDGPTEPRPPAKPFAICYNKTMYKILFPETENDYIKTATTQLSDICEPVLANVQIDEATQMLADGEVDAMIAGIDYSSRDVILSTRDHVGAAGKTFSSLFVAKFSDGRRLIVSDGATCKNPTAEQLADIIELAHDAAAKILDDAPRLAVLSFSTFGSGGHDPSMEKTAEAISAIRARRPDILVDGEMQLDAAVDPRVGEKKTAARGGSDVAGHANVLIVPDINSGNILYKSIEQFAGATVAGPILLGFNKPVSDLSRGSTVDDIILTAESLVKLI